MRKLFYLAGLILLIPASASAHNSSWYWSEGKTGLYLDDRGYSIDAYCVGFGRSHSWGRDRSIRLYRHFDCYDVDGEEYTVHVTGRKWARVY